MTEARLPADGKPGPPPAEPSQSYNHLDCSRRGRVRVTESMQGNTVVTAHVPPEEMTCYVRQIRSMTGGRRYHTMEFVSYETVSQHLAPAILEAHKSRSHKEGFGLPLFSPAHHFFDLHRREYHPATCGRDG